MSTSVPPVEVGPLAGRPATRWGASGGGGVVATRLPPTLAPPPAAICLLSHFCRRCTTPAARCAWWSPRTCRATGGSRRAAERAVGTACEQAGCRRRGAPHDVQCCSPAALPFPTSQVLTSSGCRVEVCTDADTILPNGKIKALIGAKCDGVIGQLTEARCSLSLFRSLSVSPQGRCWGARLPAPCGSRAPPPRPAALNSTQP